MPMSAEFKKQRFAELNGIARKQGGKLKARSYELMHKPMRAECRRGHRFSITPKNILRGLWCKQCQPLPRQEEFLAAAAQIARESGGKCLSTFYTNARAKLLWQCGNRHRWEATFDNVANKGSWCPDCALESASERKANWWRKRKRAGRRKAGK